MVHVSLNPGKMLDKAAKSIGNIAKNPTKLVTNPLKQGFSSFNKTMTGVFGQDLGTALTYGALVAAAVYTGGAAAGAMGVAGASGAAALGSTAGMAAVGAGAYAGLSASQAQTLQEKAEKAQAQAQAQAEQAERESTILQKQALLASQKSMTARQATAAQVANKLKNTTSGVLGDEEEKLGD